MTPHHYPKQRRHSPLESRVSVMQRSEQNIHQESRVSLGMRFRIS
eukprot:XP_001709427.1 Hypothetical protein GL50803_31516 [Giardia lamblia ATCC 50803]